MELAKGWPTYIGITHEAAIDFPKMFRAPLCGHVPKLFTVSGHKHRDLAGGLGKVK